MNTTAIPIESAHIEPVGAIFASVKRPRMESVDLLRAVIMIIMALDHTRDFLTNAAFSATDLCYVRYGQIHSMFQSHTLAQYPFTRPPGWGVSLPTVYFIWTLVVVALYPVCRWYAALKTAQLESLAQLPLSRCARNVSASTSPVFCPRTARNKQKTHS